MEFGGMLRAVRLLVSVALEPLNYESDASARIRSGKPGSMLALGFAVFLEGFFL